MAHIDVYCNDGSPLGLTWDHIYNGLGIGGAELAMLTWAEFMVKRGHLVRIYNNPRPGPATVQGIEFLNQRDFIPNESRDVFIAWRSPNPYLRHALAKFKIHWSTDQCTTGNYQTDIIPFIDKIICISPFHKEYYFRVYGPPENKITYLDLGVRLEDYKLEVQKVKGRCIFCSVPDRGLEVIARIWPGIRQAIPEAHLIITSDYRLWGAPAALDYDHRLRLVKQEGITYLGAVPRRKLVELQLSSQVQLYPCTYDELFCISAAECQVAGAYPLTSDLGALQTTNQFGAILPGHPADPAWQRDFTALTIETLKDQRWLTSRAEYCIEHARERFSWHKIIDDWEIIIEEGLYGPREEKAV